ncbi:MAG TPA: FdtA/QdtA family cupin domain-containing protein [Solirubrobacteraceae bacterium]|jgi:dTDP-4-dehydrorhamnose 3,5-epimerase-like enzyme|nr:FdtA/QdtA family cupin domain-containing protein [Solirubrobacteraceae bacterium]
MSEPARVPALATVDDCRLIELPTVPDPRGKLSIVESARQIPFAIQRFYYLYEVPAGATRGGHAHRRLHQFLVGISGSFDVVLSDGTAERRVMLNRPHVGLYIPPMIWRDMSNFSSGSVCAVLASDFYDEDDYLREYDGFLTARRSASAT